MFLSYGVVMVMDLEASSTNRKLTEVLEHKLRRYDIDGSIQCILCKRMQYGTMFLWENVEGAVTSELYKDRISDGWKPIIYN